MMDGSGQPIPHDCGSSEWVFVHDLNIKDNTTSLLQTLNPKHQNPEQHTL
jgi:hypothetical protein